VRIAYAVHIYTEIQDRYLLWEHDIFVRPTTRVFFIFVVQYFVSRVVSRFYLFRFRNIQIGSTRWKNKPLPTPPPVYINRRYIGLHTNTRYNTPRACCILFIHSFHLVVFTYVCIPNIDQWLRRAAEVFNIWIRYNHPLKTANPNCLQ